ncbi:carboxypeptidase D-like isoform X2 [Symsagittifera roscoffensis]|uniref:carboxypeptidase D-like isoform X2 n=1 Tax=Symsagittifera roscoffensis TaxID=84072 RepID=UPI00307B230E
MLISPVNCATIVKMNSFKCRLVICAFLLSVGFVLCLSSPSFPVLNLPSVSREDLQLGTSVDLQHTAYEWEPYIRLEQYHDQDQLEKLLYKYQTDFPELVRVHLLGLSGMGRAILAVRVSDNPDEDVELDEPAVKYVANMHGNEVVGRELMLSFVEYLCEGYYSNSTIKQLVDSHDIWIVPTMNPDGFAQAKEGECCGVKGRTNNANVDLNRNFKIMRQGDPLEKISNQFESYYQPETKALADFIRNRQFVLSANFHGGALVANYPYDAAYNGVKIGDQNYAACPDDAVFRSISRLYADMNPIMRLESPHLDAICGHVEDSFDRGVVNGAHWYEVLDGMQDYNYFMSNAFEITVELGVCKYPLHSKLQYYWDSNKQSLLHYIRQASTMGIRGRVVDAKNSSGVKGAEIRVREIEHDVVSVKGGSFFRLLVPGTYHVMAVAEGYLNSPEVQIKVDANKQTVQNFYLYPSDKQLQYRDKEYFRLSELSLAVEQPGEYRASMDPDSFIEKLHEKYPELTFIYSIGKSFKKHEMNVLVISDNPSLHEKGEPEMKLISSLHGNELVGLEVLATFAEYILANYGTNREVTWLVDNTRIHFLLSANPDGRLKTLTTLKYDLTNQPSKLVWSTGRENGNRSDLNRNFLYDGTPQSLLKLQPETRNIIQWMHNVPFILSIAYHGGTKVVCYPYDHAKNTIVEDIDVFRYISHNYVETNPGMKGGYPCPKEWPQEKFPGGYLSGGDWYPFEGGMQDVNYNYSNCLEFSIEVSCEKVPPAVELPLHWNDNRESLVTFLKMAHIGVSGFVTNLEDGSAVSNCTVSVAEIGHDMHCTDQGEYWRLLAPGTTYTLTVSAKGFVPYAKRVFVSEPNHAEGIYNAQRVDFVLETVAKSEAKKNPWVEKLHGAMSAEEIEIEMVSYEDVIGFFKALAIVFPETINMKYLGSDLNGLQLIVMEISASSSPNEATNVPHIAVTGGLTETDLKSVNTLAKFTLDLVMEYENGVPYVRKLLTGAVVHIVPYFYPSQLRDSVSSQQTATESIESCQKSPGANDMNRHKLQPESAAPREVGIFENWLKQQPLVFTLQVAAGFRGLYVPPEMDLSTESMVRGKRIRRDTSVADCPNSPSQADVSTNMIDSVHTQYGISSAMVGIGCCGSSPSISAQEYTDFSVYTKCLLANVSSHAVVLIAQTDSGRFVVDGLEISCACNYSNNRPKSSAGRHQILLTQPGKQNISASWNNVTVTKPVFVNASATSPDVVTIVFHSAHALVDPKHPSDTSGGGTSFIQSAVTVLIISGIHLVVLSFYF